MKKMKWIIFVVTLTLAASGVFAQNVVLISQIVTAGQIAAAIESDRAAPEEIAYAGDGKYFMVEETDPDNEKVFLVDTAMNPPTFTLITDEMALKAKVDAANGDDPAPATLNIQGLGVDDDGDVIIASDFSGAETGLIFHVNPETSDITLLAGLDGPAGQTSVEGVAFIAVKGRTVYVVLEANFGALNGDSIATVSADAPDGGQTSAEEFVSEDAFRELLGFVDPLAFRPVGFLPNGNLVIANSASGAASDDVLEINLETGAVSLLVAATDIEADLGVSDIGQNGGAIDPDGTIYLMNAFGVGDSDDSIIVVRNAGNGVGDAALLATEAAIIASPNITNINGEALAGLFLVNNTGVSPGVGEFVFVEGNCDCLIRTREIPVGN